MTMGNVPVKDSNLLTPRDEFYARQFALETATKLTIEHGEDLSPESVLEDAEKYSTYLTGGGVEQDEPDAGHSELLVRARNKLQHNARLTRAEANAVLHELTVAASPIGMRTGL